MFIFKEYPTQEQIESCINQHNKYIDYVKVWFDDNTKKIYYNTEYVVLIKCDFGLGKYRYEVDFYNSDLSKEGSFGRLGIIRSKRVKILKKER